MHDVRTILSTQSITATEGTVVQLSPTPPATWTARPDVTGTPVQYGSRIADRLLVEDIDQLTDAFLELFDSSGDRSVNASEARVGQQWAFASDARGSDRPQYVYSHSTIRREVVTMAPLVDAAAGSDAIATRAELRRTVAAFDLDGDGRIEHQQRWDDPIERPAFDAAFQPTVVSARDHTVRGRVAGARFEHLIDDSSPHA